VYTVTVAESVDVASALSAPSELPQAARIKVPTTTPLTMCVLFFLRIVR
jgi:hypothetical protein